MSTDREGPADWEELRERLREFYAYAFLPPSVTNDEFDGDSEAESEIDGPRKPPAEPRVVAGSADTTARHETVELARQYARQSRDRADEFYEYVFLPPSYTNDDFGAGPSSGADIETGPADFDGFVFTEWLDAARPTGPQKPPAQPRVVTDEIVTTGETIDQDRRFEFVEWLASGESGFEPIDIGEGPAEPVEPATPEPGPTTGPRLGIKPHPAKAATYALFLAVLTLAVLSVVGYAPVLGPATGLGG